MKPRRVLGVFGNFDLRLSVTECAGSISILDVTKEYGALRKSVCCYEKS